MKKLLIYTLLTLLALTPTSAAARKAKSRTIPPSTPRQFEKSVVFQGAGYAEITIVATEADEEKANGSIMQAISDATAKTNSAIYAVKNIQPKTPTEIDPWLFNVIERCKTFSALTSGAFDITISNNDESLNRDWKKLKLKSSNSTLTINSSEIQIDPKIFGIVLRGFLADKIIDTLRNNGWSNAQVKIDNVTRNIGRDIHGQWTIRLDAPTEAEKGKYAFRAYNYSVSDIGTAVISQSVFPEGIVDPKSNSYITNTAVISTIIFAADAATAAAYAIATYANSLNKAEKGLQFIHAHPEVKGIVIGFDGTVLASPGLGINRAPYDQIAPASKDNK